MPSKLKGKKFDKPVAITYCDFGAPDRRSEIKRHFSISCAMRSYPKVWQIFSRRHNWRVWIEYIGRK